MPLVTGRAGRAAIWFRRTGGAGRAWGRHPCFKRIGDIGVITLPLYDPTQHRPLDSGQWTETTARGAIEAIACDAIDAYQGPERLWPNAPDDLEGDPDAPFRSAYLGASGVGWALELLAREGLSPELPGLAELADSLPEGFRRAPEFVGLAPPPAPSLLFGESGILLMVEAIRHTGAHLDDLEACIRRNARNPSRELCWGSPGTMVAALELWRRTRQERWRETWLDSANWLLDEWHECVWVQDLYGKRRRYTGAGHGFASNAFVLLAGRDLLGDRARDVVDRLAAVFRELAVEEDGVAQWPPLADDATGRRPVQWCHGSPGMITSLSGLPADDETDGLMAAGGELIWRAGPLTKGVGLCHGTAGNAYAFLSLYARLGDERWLHRARRFAMDAAADVCRRRAANARGRYTLFTGDIGVALLLRSCLNADPAFPVLAGGNP
ncbi:MAG: LanC-like protein [Solirubrobacteraceae bacterium]